MLNEEFFLRTKHLSRLGLESEFFQESECEFDSRDVLLIEINHENSVAMRQGSRKVCSVPEDQTERLVAANLKRNEELHAYRQVVSDTAHDLNNLLFLISGYTELLTKNLDDRNQLLETIKNIQNATSSVRELSKKLQEIAPVENDETKSESVLRKETDEQNVIRPGDVNIVVFVFDGELKQLVSRILEREGFGVGKIVINGFGISTNRDSEESVDLIIADVDIFKLSRVRARQVLRKYPLVPFLLLTNGGDELPKIAAAGGSSSLTKSFRPSELVAEINRILAQGKSRAQSSGKQD